MINSYGLFWWCHTSLFTSVTLLNAQSRNVEGVALVIECQQIHNKWPILSHPIVITPRGKMARWLEVERNQIITWMNTLTAINPRNPLSPLNRYYPLDWVNWTQKLIQCVLPWGIHFPRICYRKQRPTTRTFPCWEYGSKDSTNTTSIVSVCMYVPGKKEGRSNPPSRDAHALTFIDWANGRGQIFLVCPTPVHS